jgi:thioredoxin 1
VAPDKRKSAAWGRLWVLLAAVVAAAFLPNAAFGDFGHLPVKGVVTMIDLGATNCVPCKMMAPILKKVEKDYEGRAVIAFIDVWQHHDQVARFGIRAIPTQVFYDPEGQEVYRHVGFMSEADIVSQLRRMGVQ